MRAQIKITLVALLLSACSSGAITGTTDAPPFLGGGPGVTPAVSECPATCPAGPTGKDGLVGPTGPAGAVGPAGSPGPQGPMGTTGDAGPKGDPGAPGAVGPMGPSGAAASIGPAGPAGPTGAQGPSGAQGSPGAQGPAGKDGKDGAAFNLTKANLYTAGSANIPSASCKDNNDVLLTYTCLCGGGFCQGAIFGGGITDTSAPAGINCVQAAASGAPAPTATVVCINVPN